MWSGVVRQQHSMLVTPCPEQPTFLHTGLQLRNSPPLLSGVRPKWWLPSLGLSVEWSTRHQPNSPNKHHLGISLHLPTPILRGVDCCRAPTDIIWAHTIGVAQALGAPSNHGRWRTDVSLLGLKFALVAAHVPSHGLPSTQSQLDLALVSTPLGFSPLRFQILVLPKWVSSLQLLPDDLVYRCHMVGSTHQQMSSKKAKTCMVILWQDCYGNAI